MSRAAALRGATAAVDTTGLGIAAYLTVVHYTGAAPACAIAHGCEVVQGSAYAKLAGVPVALLGLLGYVLILAGCCGTTRRPAPRARWSRSAARASRWLTFVEILRLEAICIWCVGSAICMVLLAGLRVARLLGAPAAPPPQPERMRRARPSARRA